MAHSRSHRHHERLKQPARRFPTSHVPQTVYLGLDIEVVPEKQVSNFHISVHDGSYTIDFFSGKLCHHQENTSSDDWLKDSIKKAAKIVREYSVAQKYKVQLIALSCAVDESKEGNKDVVQRQYNGEEWLQKHTEISYFWRELDALPFFVKTHCHRPDERASAAVRKAVVWLSPGSPGNLLRTPVGFRHEVEVDYGYQVHMVDLAEYQKTVSERTWRILKDMVKTYKERRLRVSFFSSTPQGGGVALMRHALLRFLKLNGIRVHWYVARPKPEIFDITKRKIHNVLQGVASPDTHLKDEDKEAFTEWSDENAERFWVGPAGPIENSDMIIIDDPQLTGIIPHIKKHAPKARIIFRSHIEIGADLIRKDPEGKETYSWSFLWNFIKDADLFIAHPIKDFVPDDVPDIKIALMPATTDPLDGLNKQLTPWCTTYYQRVFNRTCVDQGANVVDWTRPYFVQVARFDPSKGIPDCLESYCRLRQRLEREGYDPHKIPQLVVCGHGSIDDPEGVEIYEHTHAQLGTITYSDDITVARLPPSDQLLNMIMRGARGALQLSHREGFEVKVTEALHKGIPVIAYHAGGIPLQIQRDVNGFLIPIGDVDQVADKMYTLLTDNEVHDRMSKAALDCLTEEYFTVWNAMNWLYIFNELSARDHSGEGSEGKTNNGSIGHNTLVSDMWWKKYAERGF